MKGMSREEAAVWQAEDDATRAAMVFASSWHTVRNMVERDLPEEQINQFMEAMLDSRDLLTQALNKVAEAEEVRFLAEDAPGAKTPPPPPMGRPVLRLVNGGPVGGLNNLPGDEN